MCSGIARSLIMSLVILITQNHYSFAKTDGWPTCLRTYHSEAVKACTEIIESGNYDDGLSLSRAYYHRANALQSQASYKEAIEDYTAAIKENPQYYESYVNRGRVFLRNIKNYEKARDDFRAAGKLRPTSSYAFQLLGEAYFGLKEFDRATTNYLKAVELGADPKGPIHGLIASSLHASGKSKEALPYAKKHTEAKSKYPSAWVSLGTIHESLGNTAEAIKAYRQADRLDLFRTAHTARNALVRLGAHPEGQKPNAKTKASNPIAAQPEKYSYLAAVLLSFAALVMLLFFWLIHTLHKFMEWRFGGSFIKFCLFLSLNFLAMSAAYYFTAVLTLVVPRWLDTAIEMQGSIPIFTGVGKEVMRWSGVLFSIAIMLYIGAKFGLLGKGTSGAVTKTAWYIFLGFGALLSYFFMILGVVPHCDKVERGPGAPRYDLATCEKSYGISRASKPR